MRKILHWWSQQCMEGRAGLIFLNPFKKGPAGEWKIFLQLRGNNIFEKGGERLGIPPGFMGVLGADSKVTESWKEDSTGRYIHFFIGIYPGRLSANFVDGHPPRIQTGMSIPFTQSSLLERMLLFASAKQPASAAQCAVIADILLDGMRISGPDGPSRLVQNAMQAILDHPCNPDLSVKWLAQQLNCHPDYLSRRFHEETGTSLMTYVRSKRMEIAADLLRTHQMTVADVAAGCGYRDHSYFTRIFHQTYGVVPSQWGRADSIPG